MKNLLPLLLLALLPLSCKEKKEADPRPLLVVSVEPLRTLTQSIAGEGWRVESVVPRGASPETYDPTPGQLLTFSSARACLLTGLLPSEKGALEKMIASVPQLPVFTLSEGLPLLSLPDGGTDPHIWTSPRLTPLVAGNICRALCRVDSLHAPLYLKNLERVAHRADSLDKELKQELSTLEKRAFLTLHPSLGYLARDYGLRQLPVMEGEHEPSPAHLAALVRSVREDGACALFVQEGFPDNAVRTLSQETGLKPNRMDPLSPRWDEEVVRLVRIMKKH